MASFTTLYSGSSGNCAVVEENGAYLLIDMGKSCRQTVAFLKQMGLSPEGLQGILITHEHSDHISGLSVFLKKHPVPVYGYGESLAFLQRQQIVPEHVPCLDVKNKSLHVGDFWVESFETSHDSLACCGYRVVTRTQKPWRLPPTSALCPRKCWQIYIAPMWLLWKPIMTLIF